jgi:ABC-type transport system involved in cytochrome c biogenesis ATPase subunit
VLVSIRNNLNTLHSHIRYDVSWDGYVFYLGHKQKLKPLVASLQNVKLKTRKRHEFHVWAQIHQVHLDPSLLASKAVSLIYELQKIKAAIKVHNGTPQPRIRNIHPTTSKIDS